MQYEYVKLGLDVLRIRLDYSKLLASIQKLCNLYSDNHVEIQARIKHLRKSIRNITKGVNTIYSVDAITDSLYLENTTEQLYVANQTLLKAAYKKLANLVHPDKATGNAELFIAVNAAYRNKDLVYIQQLYVSLVNSKDLFWIQLEGIKYQQQELVRPQVSFTILKHSPLYNIGRLHAIGQEDLCSKLVLEYLLIQEVNLLQEYGNLKNTQFNLNKDVKNGN